MQLESWLNDVSDVLAEQKKRKKSQFQCGEMFNTFSILGLGEKEVRLHSAFIAELLNPRGSHGMEDAFLNAFMDIVAPGWNFKSKNILVEKEHSIGVISKDGKRGGRLDIVVSDNSRVLVIENKVNAEDQPNQLLRYHNYLCEQDGKERLLIYLTKDGHEASELSTGGVDFEYKCISYKRDIISWLNRCMELSEDRPQVHFAIKEYLLNIREILDIMDDDLSKKIVDIVLKPENTDAYLEAMALFNDVSVGIRRRFIEDLGRMAEKYGLKLNNDDEVEWLNRESFLYLYNPDESERWALCIGNDTIASGYYYGISHFDDQKGLFKKELPLVTNVRELFRSICEVEGEEYPSWPLGYNYLSINSEYENSLYWNRWDYIPTLQSMNNGDMLEYIEEHLVQPVVENNIIKKLEAALRTDWLKTK